MAITKYGMAVTIGHPIVTAEASTVWPHFLTVI
jgi:hypothetical protein